MAISISFNRVTLQEASDELGRDGVAVQVVFRERRRISEAVGFGDLLAGHLQIVETVTLFRFLQVDAVDREIRPALLRLGIREPPPVLRRPFGGDRRRR